MKRVNGAKFKTKELLDAIESAIDDGVDLDALDRAIDAKIDEHGIEIAGLPDPRRAVWPVPLAWTDADTLDHYGAGGCVADRGRLQCFPKEPPVGTYQTKRDK